MFVSVIVCTKNRDEQLAQCIRNILLSSYTKFELIIIDQGKKDKSDFFNKVKQVRYFKCAQKGLGHARNYGVKKSRYQILAFTDDDCLVKKEWISEVIKSFKMHKNISAVFGRTIPHFPKKNKKLICTCTFERKEKYPVIISKPSKHWEDIGFGNNMAFRKKVFTKLGMFKEWLGSGSIIGSAEDAEISLRLLLMKKNILYNPFVCVEHNSWLNSSEVEYKNLAYLRGEIACYAYFSFMGHAFAKKILYESCTQFFIKESRDIISFAIRLKCYTFVLIYWWIKKLYTIISTLFITFYFYLKEDLIS